MSTIEAKNTMKGVVNLNTVKRANKVFLCVGNQVLSIILIMERHLPTPNIVAVFVAATKDKMALSPARFSVNMM